MKIWKPGEKQRSNTPLVLIYGETNVGKSTSSLASLPEPILDIVTAEGGCDLRDDRGR